MVKKLLSLPVNLVHYFHKLKKAEAGEWFCTSDPIDRKLGSGGGSSWLLEKCRENENGAPVFSDWLKKTRESCSMQEAKAVGYLLMPLPVRF